MYTVTDLHKSYGGVKALDGVDFEIHPGEVHALLGANGAGKSTLIKVLVGGTRPDAGTLRLDGEPVAFSNSREAAERGVAIVSQELTLFPHLDVLQNLFLGREPLAGGVALDRRAMRRLAQPVLAAIGLDVDVTRPLATLRLGEQQLVEVARALLNDPKILVLDEPTSALQATETERLLGIVRGLRDRGVGVVYVSHFLEDVFAVADRITVLRSGRVVVARRPREEMSIQGTVREMLGEAAVREARADDADAFEDVVAAAAPLVLEGVAVDGVLAPLDLTAEPGEVVGLAGLEGSGAQAVLDVIFGRLRPSAGTVTLPSGRRRPRSMNRAVAAGVAYVPADRKHLGLMLDASVTENISTVKSGALRRTGIVQRRGRMRRRAEHWRRELNIVMASPAQPVGSLSGGNQQKVVFAKWLEAEPSVILLDDPSRGVDMGAKEEMHAIIAQMAASRKIVLYTSSDLEEMAKVCDRVIVFFAGRAVGELVSEELSEHGLLESINVGTTAVGAGGER
ncbi:MAG: sugar ABC transporter ATP-binding protein [Actinobacteria bacterium]|nr:sugar ABC transporter ATP-binding protein [Actinomycetota bacterium]